MGSKEKVCVDDHEKPALRQDWGLDENLKVIETIRVDFIISTSHSAFNETLKTPKISSSLINKETWT